MPKHRISRDVIEGFQDLQKQLELQTTFFDNFKKQHGIKKNITRSPSPTGRQSLMDRQKQYSTQKRTRDSLSANRFNQSGVNPSDSID